MKTSKTSEAKERPDTAAVIKKVRKNIREIDRILAQYNSLRNPPKQPSNPDDETDPT